jgi:hypothetical protein
MDEKYSKEIDLLYRLRFERGLIPLPDKISDPKLKELVEKLNFHYGCVMDYDAKIMELYKENERMKLVGTHTDHE